MLETFSTWPVVWQALAATTFTWALTALGAGVVFFFKEVSRKALDAALGFTAGVMIAASFWSLLNPAIDLSEEMGMVKWIPPLVGFLAGAVSMRLVDYVLPPVHLFGQMEEAEGVKTRWQRTTLLAGDHTPQHSRGPRDRRRVRRGGGGFRLRQLLGRRRPHDRHRHPELSRRHRGVGAAPS
jgi:zinc transporter ZupT